MRGPGHRNRFDVRRIWECPVCQKRVKTSGQIVTLRCEACARNKTGDTAWMKLIEPPHVSRFKKPPVQNEAPAEQQPELPPQAGEGSST